MFFLICFATIHTCTPAPHVVLGAKFMRSRSNYITGLYKMLEHDNEKRQLTKEDPPHTVKSLELQLVQFQRTLSKEQLRQSWTMKQIIGTGALTGKYRDRPHPQQVAEILTRYAWTKRRLYGALYSGKTYWFPPAS